MRKLSAHYIFPVSSAPLKNGIITVDDCGVILDVSSENAGVCYNENTEFFDGIICPGFVNAHCHLELSHMKNLLPEHSGLIGFISEISNLRKTVSEDEQLEAAKYYDKFMHSQGIVAVGDISNRDLTFELKLSSKIKYHTFIEAYGRDKNKFTETLEKNTELIELGRQLGLSVSPTPHAPYSMSNELFFEISYRAQNSGIISIHNQETKAENEYFSSGSGDFLDFYSDTNTTENPSPIKKTSIHRLLDYLSDDELNILLVHNTFTSGADCKYAMNSYKNLTFVLCPMSNLYIENTLPDVEMFRKNGAKIALGTDSLSSNTNLLMLNEIFAIWAKYPSVELDELLSWATLNGAKALNLDKNLGSIEKGKKPGLVFINNIDLENLCLTEKSKSSLIKI